MAVATLEHTVINEYIPVHHVVVQPVHDQRRDSHLRRPAGPRADQLRRSSPLAACWPASSAPPAPPCCWCVRLLGDQFRAEARGPYRGVFHLRGLQLRRAAVADRRSAAVFGISERRQISCGRCRCGKAGCSSTALLLALYFLRRSFRLLPARDQWPTCVRDETQVRRLKFSGLWPNGLLLVGVILSVALLDPAKPFPGTDWHPWIYLREMVQLALVAVSLLLGPHTVRDDNNFDYLAIVEVGGAVYRHLRGHAAGPGDSQRPRGQPGHRHAAEVFLGNGLAVGRCSTMRRPTWCFSRRPQTLSADGGGASGGRLRAAAAGISLGAVLMGAMTYIGNGPNFMVKTIAEKSGVRMPSFFGYMVLQLRHLAADPGDQYAGCSSVEAGVAARPAAAGGGRTTRLGRYDGQREPARTIPARQPRRRAARTHHDRPRIWHDLCRDVAGAPTIAFDTEFVSEHTYRPAIVLDPGGGRRTGWPSSIRWPIGDVRPFWELLAADRARDDRSCRARGTAVLPGCCRAAADASCSTCRSPRGWWATSIRPATAR